MTLEAKQMRVEGEDIPKAVVSAIIRRMKGKKPFRQSDLIKLVESELTKRKISSVKERHYIAMRVADRMTQKARKAGAIERGTEPGRKMYWSWAGDR